MPANRRPALALVLGAVYGLLNVPSITDVLAPGGVHHAQAPENLSTDYLLLQGPSAQRWDSMQENGERVTFRTDAVTMRPDYGNALAIRAAAIPLVDNQQVFISDNHYCVVARWLESVDPYKDPELVNGKPVWHAIDLFEILVEQIS